MKIYKLDIYENSNGDTVIDLAFNHQTITLSGVSAQSLSEGNFYGVDGNLSDALSLSEDNNTDEEASDVGDNTNDGTQDSSNDELRGNPLQDINSERFSEERIN